MMKMNRKGSTELFFTMLLGLLVANPFVFTSINAVLDSPFVDSLQTLSATMQPLLQQYDNQGNLLNTEVSSIQIQQIQNSSAWSYEVLQDVENPTRKLLVVVSYDEILNAIDGKTLYDLENETVSNRGFFVQSTTESYNVDPLNSTYCAHDYSENTYMCTFPFNSTATYNPDGTWYETDLSGSSTKHDRKVRVVTFDADGTFVPTTSESVNSYYFTQSKKVIGMVVQVFEYGFYFIVIAMSVGGILILVWILRTVYDAIANRGEEK